MTKYRIAKNQTLEVGKDVKLEKVTTAERIIDNIAKILIISTAALFIFNLIRFIF